MDPMAQMWDQFFWPFISLSAKQPTDFEFEYIRNSGSKEDQQTVDASRKLFNLAEKQYRDVIAQIQQAREQSGDIQPSD